jgi:uncharacterized protein
MNRKPMVYAVMFVVACGLFSQESKGAEMSKTAADPVWDKTFLLSDKVDYQKVTFKNRYGITLAGDLYLP